MDPSRVRHGIGRVNILIYGALGSAIAILLLQWRTNFQLGQLAHSLLEGGPSGISWSVRVVALWLVCAQLVALTCLLVGLWMRFHNGRVKQALLPSGLIMAAIGAEALLLRIYLQTRDAPLVELPNLIDQSRAVLSLISIILLFVCIAGRSNGAPKPSAQTHVDDEG